MFTCRWAGAGSRYSARQLGHPLTEGVNQNNFIKLQVGRLRLLMFINPSRTTAGFYDKIVIVLLAVHALGRELLFSTSPSYAGTPRKKRKEVSSELDGA